MTEPKRPIVKARCASGPLDLEVWKGSGEDGPYVVIRIKSGPRGRLWLFIEPAEWEELKDLVGLTLKED